MGHSAHELPNKNWRLWTRGGTNDVYIQRIDADEEIEIPSELLKMLVAADVISYRVSELEQMEDNDALGLPKGHVP